MLHPKSIPNYYGECVLGYDIKGNNGHDAWIYHTKDSPFYYRVKAEACFKTENDAKRSGYRKFKVYNRYSYGR